MIIIFACQCMNKLRAVVEEWVNTGLYKVSLNFFKEVLTQHLPTLVHVEDNVKISSIL